jgi:3-hydroxy-9,10-secoandrosta-1,3,5(10)-triene-9,17-dione monooxygenase reductase component
MTSGAARDDGHLDEHRFEGAAGTVDAYVDGEADGDFEFRPGEIVGVQAEDARAVERDRLFRDVLGRFATGVTVVTGLLDGVPYGLSCLCCTSVSLDPPLVLFCPARTSRAWPLIQRSGHFCVNILAGDQVEVSRTMAGRGTDKFSGLDWSPSAATGSPVLAGTLGFVDATISSVHEAGDHFVVVGRVLDLEARDADRPLLFFKGGYGTTEG